MDKATYWQCSQCFSQNSLLALQCNICQQALTDNSLEVTRAASPAANAETGKSTDTHSPEFECIAYSPALPEITNISLKDELAHFSIVDILGRGGMGTVYRATDSILQRDVALKLLRTTNKTAALNTDNDNQVITDQNTKALLEEARIACKLNHPNIVTIYDVGRSHNSNFIVMEWVDGQSLDEVIPSQGLTLQASLKYANGIARGLVCAHQQQIIHRDIKPQNIMLTRKGHIKILDFGIAGLIQSQTKQHNIQNNSPKNKPSTEPKKVNYSGTISHMAPEQIQGQAGDARADIFSFGVVLYKMLSGQHPFIQPSNSKLTAVNSDYIPINQYLPKLPTRIVVLLEKMLAADINQRWQSADELAKEIHDIYQQLMVKENWWQRRHKITKLAIMLPLLLVMLWSFKTLLFPPSTQDLIAQQLQGATKIALLPFDNISGDPQLQLFNDALAVSLSSDLADVGRVHGDAWVIPSSEIRRMQQPSVQKIYDKYAAELILTGSVQHMGSTRSLVLELINAKDGRQLKSAEMIIDAEQLFQGYSQVRMQMLGLFGWSVPELLVKKFSTRKPQFDGAYKKYIQGIGYLYRSDQAGNLSKAGAAFDQAIRLDPDYESAYVGLATTQLYRFSNTKQKHWLDRMELTINKLSDLNPSQSLINYLSGQLMRKRGQYPQAIILLENSIEQNPKHIESFFELAYTKNKMGALNKAEAIYLKAIEMSPNNWLGIAYLGYFYNENGMYLKAIELYKKQLVSTPNNYFTHLNIASSYYFLGQIDGAIKYTEQAIKINPTDEAYSNLGTMYFYIKDYTESVLAFEKAITIKDSNYMIWGNLADASRLANDDKTTMAYQKAANLALAALTINPNDTIASSLLSVYFANLGKVKLALQYSKVITQQNTGQENFIVATAYDILRNKELTLIHLAYAIEKNYPMKEITSTPLLANIKSDKRFRRLVSNE
jgi:serine/threonine protein kinase/Tfp pilus assembly protein PilF